MNDRPFDLRDCSKTELITIIERMRDGLGPAAEAFLDLELLRTECLRLKAAVEDLRK